MKKSQVSTEKRMRLIYARHQAPARKRLRLDCRASADCLQFSSWFESKHCGSSQSVREPACIEFFNFYKQIKSEQLILTSNKTNKRFCF